VSSSYVYFNLQGPRCAYILLQAPEAAVLADALSRVLEKYAKLDGDFKPTPVKNDLTKSVASTRAAAEALVETAKSEAEAAEKAVEAADKACDEAQEAAQAAASALEAASERAADAAIAARAAQVCTLRNEID